MVRSSLPASQITRTILALFAALAFIASDMSAAVAQGQNCSQLANMIRSIERDSDYAAFQNNARELQNWQQEVQRAESQWARLSCQQVLNSGQALTGECRGVAQTITLGRNQISQYQSLASQGQTLARDRERLLQDFNRFNCSASQSGVNFSTQSNQRSGLLTDMFGGGVGYVEQPYDDWSYQQTRRTVCVRTTDGYYWPISFATTDDYIAQDAIKCHETCPAGEVALFSYRNPGEEPEDMISLSGTPYRSMPYAFQFRTEVDMDSSCTIREPVGTLAVNATGNGSQTAIDFGALEFPLPQKDPRGIAATMVMADAIYVPLPRPRPREDGTASAQVTGQPDVEGVEDMQIVEFGDRVVRIVGPQTPFVPEQEAES